MLKFRTIVFVCASLVGLSLSANATEATDVTAGANVEREGMTLALEAFSDLGNPDEDGAATLSHHKGKKGKKGKRSIKKKCLAKGKFTKDQKAQAKQAYKDFQPLRANLWSDVKKKRKALMTVLKDTSSVEKTAQQKAEELSDSYAAAHAATAEFKVNLLYDIATPEQRVAFLTCLEKYSKRKKGKRGKRKRRGHGHH